ncbi:MAG: DUF5011 domain-containing protein, partial [Bacteroidetes bacterium]|nr:DUF5011 domain-containing protein [Bacteroidota bacterium]
GATVTDNVDATRTITGSGSVDTATVGFYTVTYTATDAAGNLAVPVTRTVNVVLDPAGDEDGDGISNGTEISGGTDPYQKDSDGDGVNDPVELADGTNPLDPDAYNSLHKGLIGYYPLNGGAQNLFGDDGVNHGATPGADRFGNPNGSMSFNGTSNYIECGPMIPNYENATFSVWAQVGVGCQAEAGIVAKPRHPWGTGFEIRANCGEYQVQVGFNNWLDNLGPFQTNPVQSTNAWHHYVATTDGHAITFFVNGKKVGEQPFTFQNVSSPQSVLIGAGTSGNHSPGNYLFFSGLIDDVRIYNRALTPNEVAALFTFEAPYLNAPFIRGNSLYTLVDGSTWNQAEANALKLGGHLVTINDSEENDYLGSVYGNRDHFYQTYTPGWDLWDANFFWIGLTDQTNEGQWRWISGEPAEYRNWYPGAPGNPDGAAENGIRDPNGFDYTVISWLLTEGVDLPTGGWQGGMPNNPQDVPPYCRDSHSASWQLWLCNCAWADLGGGAGPSGAIGRTPGYYRGCGGKPVAGGEPAGQGQFLRRALGISGRILERLLLDRFPARGKRVPVGEWRSPRVCQLGHWTTCGGW